MKLFNKVAIIGVGLIGGSIGLAVRKKRLAGEVIGVFRHRHTLKKALLKKACDTASMDYKGALKDADLVIVASPVKKIAVLAKKGFRFMKKGAILIDAGSTKAELTKEIDKGVPKGIYFVGTHPLAGSEKSGVNFAKADIFENTVCVITKTAKTNKGALNKVKGFWQALGARVRIMSPSEHDKCLARISHLPHIVSCGLILSAGSSLGLAASGFKDTTRISSSRPELWIDIFLSNRKELLKALDRYMAVLSEIKKALKEKDKIALSSKLFKAMRLREGLG